MPFILRISRAEQNREIKGRKYRYYTIGVGVENVGWFITKRPVHTGARVLGAVLLVVTSM